MEVPQDKVEFRDYITADSPQLDKLMLPNNFYLHPETDSMKEYNEKDDFNGTHMGQVKLFLTDLYTIVQYFILYPHKEQTDCVVVYAGAAPGDHIITLAQIFPEIRFDLYDPGMVNQKKTCDFCEALRGFTTKNSERIQLKVQEFNAETAEEYSPECCSEDVIFLSDMWMQHRSQDNPELLPSMTLQQTCLWQMKPKIACLKFRAPYFQGSFDYVGGKLLKVPYAPPPSTELRLIVTKVNPVMKKYNASNIEKCMAFHNTECREDEINEYGKTFVDILSKQYVQGCARLTPKRVCNIPKLICQWIEKYEQHRLIQYMDKSIELPRRSLSAMPFSRHESWSQEPSGHYAMAYSRHEASHTQARHQHNSITPNILFQNKYFLILE